MGAATFIWTRTRSCSVLFATTMAVTSAVAFLFWIYVASAATGLARFASPIGGRRTRTVSMAWMRSIASRMLTPQMTTPWTARATTAPLRTFMFAAVMTLGCMRRLLHWIWTVLTVFTIVEALSVGGVNRFLADERRAHCGHATGNIVNESFGITEAATFAIGFSACERIEEKRFNITGNPPAIALQLKFCFQFENNFENFEFYWFYFLEWDASNQLDRSKINLPLDVVNLFLSCCISPLSVLFCNFPLAADGVP